MVKITKQLKEKFLEFCQKEYPRKTYKANLFNKEKWFYIQVGKHFSDYLHCEYINDSIQFHIEFDTEEESEMFNSLIPSIFSSVNKNWKREKNKNYIWYEIVPKTQINDEPELFEKMSEAIFLLDEGISKIEGFIKKYFD
ncbi:hypothetical protein [uncultured Treponema sp.]|uniref:hypothetical protein n=1 Tax=uncultured Treponema sp. TaxID=162155 RepID=UPI0027D9CA80|nr:hypothetical protein [uncultured Treponema sp.]